MRQRSRRPNRSYAAIPNAAMRDRALSIEARGLLALLMTYSDDWHFFVDHLQDMTGCGRDRMRRMLRELEASGYLVREVPRDERGHVMGSQWVIVDDPEGTPFGGQRSGSPLDDVPEHDARPPENPAIGTDRLKTRPPENPTAGNPDPIRKPTDKNTNKKNPPNPPAGGQGEGDGSLFDEFWAAYPKQVEREAAQRAWERVVLRGEVGAAELVLMAAAYGRSAAVARGFAKNPANWLLDGTWRSEEAWALREPNPVGKADIDAVARFWAQPVIEGKSFVATAITAAVAERMISLGLVTSRQLLEVGVVVAPIDRKMTG